MHFRSDSEDAPLRAFRRMAASPCVFSILREACFASSSFRMRSSPTIESASPADAYDLAVEQPVSLPDRRSRRRAMQSGCRKSRSSDLYRSLHRQRAVASRRGCGGRHHRSDGWRRYRWHSGGVTDAAGIVDRAVEPARIRRPRRNAADAGILGRRSSGRGQKTKDRNGEQCRSAGHPFARKDRNWLRVAHRSRSCADLSLWGEPGRTRRSSNGREERAPETVAIVGPILTIVPPCFGQTGLECGQHVVRPCVKSAGRPSAGNIGLSMERQCIPR